MDVNRFDTIVKLFADRRLSRRQAVQLGGAGLAAGGLATAGLAAVHAQNATPTAAAASEALPAEILAIIDAPRYTPSRWGVYAADRHTGEVVHAFRSEEWFLAASTSKLISGAAALDAFGPDFRFETPIYRHGELTGDGTLHGNLILVASGDMTMGGRDTPDGQIAFTSLDHINATSFPGLIVLTSEDPLAGLDDLARQVAASGVQRITGDVVIDARLFPALDKDGYILTPIWINDNLIDLTVKPGRVGDAATIEWRPQTAAYQVQADVQTVAAGQTLDLRVTSPQPGQIVVSGQIPVDQAQAVPTYQIEDPQAFARTLLIEALLRQGVRVAATPTGPNPADSLPLAGSYVDADRVALHRSLPFAENLKLIEKTSHNQHADMLVFLLALKHGKTTYAEGMYEIIPILEKAGIDPTLLSLSAGRGNDYTNLFSPHTITRLLSYMATRPDFKTYFNALPILGVDGTESTTVAPGSPAAGHVIAKSGMTVAGDVMNSRPLVMTRALTGYMTAKSGRELVFAIYLNNVPMVELNDIFSVITEHGSVADAIYRLN